MIIASPLPMTIGEICTRLYEGPPTKGKSVIVRVCALREATREEYLQYGREHFKNEFDDNGDIQRGWNNYYLISID